MAIRNDDRIALDIQAPAGVSRAAARLALLMKWGEEQAGQQYRYFAETFSDGKRLYLERPGQLNQGCDFVIFLEDCFLFNNGNDRPPSHQDLFADLAAKREQLSDADWALALEAIRAVHALKPPPALDLPECAGTLDYPRLLALCCWFFLEQDLTYWNGTGRDMLWEAISQRFGA